MNQFVVIIVVYMYIASLRNKGYYTMTLENANNLFSEREDIQEKIGFDLDGFLLLKIPQSS